MNAKTKYGYETKMAFGMKSLNIFNPKGIDRRLKCKKKNENKFSLSMCVLTHARTYFIYTHQFSVYKFTH